MRRTAIFFVFFCIFIFLLLGVVGYSLSIKTTALPPNTVALTFDDGPSPYFTPKILSILKKYNVKATFFVIGDYAVKHPNLLKMEDADGHTIENHSLTHADLTEISDEQLNNEILKPQEIIYKIIKKNPLCMRPPFNILNRHVKNTIRSKGLTIIRVDLNSGDYLNSGVQNIINRVLSTVKAGDVIAFHDGYLGREQTVAALPKIIEGIQKKGLKFSKVCE